MTVDAFERAVRIAGAAGLATAWFVAVVAVRRHGLRPTGRGSGLARRVGASAAYLVVAVPYFAVWVALWWPLPGTPAPGVRLGAAVVGGVFGGTGLAMYLWGHRTLGRMYNVSSALGTELYADHALVTSGPFRFVRHPMYAGIGLAALGGLAVYRTWAMAFAVVSTLGLVFKARREEHLLASEFDETWHIYARRVPPWWPRPRAHRRTGASHAARRTS